uniref:Uncharacterized protein n=1 Tax=Magallana gigas TaxID=29159 RepID=K1QP79_MAGGI
MERQDTGGEKTNIYKTRPWDGIFRRLRCGQTSPNQNFVNTPYSSTAKALSMDTSQANWENKFKNSIRI